MKGKTTIRQEILRFIDSNKDEVSMFPPEMLEELQNRFGDRAIPGLIERLEDGHPDVRHCVVQILAFAQDNSAIPALIKRFDDDDCGVVEVVLARIQRFGPAAAEAIPKLEPWLESPNEYLRLRAAISILAIAPNRTDLLPMIWDATTSENQTARDMAREFFRKRVADDQHP